MMSNGGWGDVLALLAGYNNVANVAQTVNKYGYAMQLVECRKCLTITQKICRFKRDKYEVLILII